MTSSGQIRAAHDPAKRCLQTTVRRQIDLPFPGRVVKDLPRSLSYFDDMPCISADPGYDSTHRSMPNNRAGLVSSGQSQRSPTIGAMRRFKSTRQAPTVSEPASRLRAYHLSVYAWDRHLVSAHHYRPKTRYQVRLGHRLELCYGTYRRVISSNHSLASWCTTCQYPARR